MTIDKDHSRLLNQLHVLAGRLHRLLLPVIVLAVVVFMRLSVAFVLRLKSIVFTVGAGVTYSVFVDQRLRSHLLILTWGTLRLVINHGAQQVLRDHHNRCNCVSVLINNHRVSALCDSGAVYSAISENYFNSLHIPKSAVDTSDTLA